MRVLCAYRDPESGGTALQAIRGLVRDDDEVVAIHIIEPADLPWAATEAEFFSATERDVAAREARIVEPRPPLACVRPSWSTKCCRPY